MMDETDLVAQMCVKQRWCYYCWLWIFGCERGQQQQQWPQQLHLGWAWV